MLLVRRSVLRDCLPLDGWTHPESTHFSRTPGRPLLSFTYGCLSTDMIVGKTPVPPDGYEIVRLDVVVRLRRKDGKAASLRPKLRQSPR